MVSLLFPRSLDSSGAAGPRGSGVAEEAHSWVVGEEPLGAAEAVGTMTQRCCPDLHTL